MMQSVIYYCGNSQANYSRSTLEITVRPVAAQVEGTQWQASKLMSLAG